MAIEESVLGRNFRSEPGRRSWQTQPMIDATVQPAAQRVCGNAASTEEESSSAGLALNIPQYTRPAEWMGQSIPPGSAIWQPCRDLNAGGKRSQKQSPRAAAARIYGLPGRDGAQD